MPVLPRVFVGKTSGTFGVKVFNDQGVLQNISRYGFTAQAYLYTAMQNSLLELEAEAKRLIAYGYYQPAIDTGRMRNSVNSQITEFSFDNIEGTVGTAVYYAIYVHEGTRQSYGLQAKSGSSYFNAGMGMTGWHMPPRPFLADALIKKRVSIERRFRSALKRIKR